MQLSISGHHVDVSDALKSYVELAPNAPDIGQVKGMVNALSQ